MQAPPSPSGFALPSARAISTARETSEAMSMSTNYLASVTRREQQSKSPAERADRAAAEQRRLKQECADRRQARAVSSAAAARSSR
jgi:hypothetical protein